MPSQRVGRGNAAPVTAGARQVFEMARSTVRHDPLTAYHPPPDTQLPVHPPPQEPDRWSAPARRPRKRSGRRQACSRGACVMTRRRAGERGRGRGGGGRWDQRGAPARAGGGDGGPRRGAATRLSASSPSSARIPDASFPSSSPTPHPSLLTPPAPRPPPAPRLSDILARAGCR